MGSGRRAVIGDSIMKEWQKGRGEEERVWVRLTDFWSVPSPPPHHPAIPSHHAKKTVESWEVGMGDCMGQRTNEPLHATTSWTREEMHLCGMENGEWTKG